VSGTVQSNNTPPAPSQEGNENLTALLSRGDYIKFSVVMYYRSGNFLFGISGFLKV